MKFEEIYSSWDCLLVVAQMRVALGFKFARKSALSQLQVAGAAFIDIPAFAEPGEVPRRLKTCEFDTQ